MRTKQKVESNGLTWGISYPGLFWPGRVNGFVEVELFPFHNVTIKEAFNYVILLSAESPSPAGLSSNRLSRKLLALNGCDHLYLTR